MKTENDRNDFNRKADAMKPIKGWIVGCLIVFLAGHVFATPYYVATSGDDTQAGTSWATALRTISNGVAQATTAGDMVVVSNGTYVLSANINIANGITISNFSSDGSATIVDGNGATRCFYINHTNALVVGLTMTNGNALLNPNINYGGGAYLNAGTILNCRFYNNSSPASGGGIYIATGRVENCFLSGNTAYDTGGGACLYLKDAIIINSTCTLNQSTYQGGGVRVEHGMVSNCLIVSNISSDTIGFGGAGVYMGGTSFVFNCTIKGNSAISSAGGGIFGRVYAGQIIDCRLIANVASNGGGIRDYGDHGRLTVQDTLIVSNTAIVSGGGVYFNSYAPCMYLSNCTIANNTASAGGGAYFLTMGTAVCCIVSGNVATAQFAGGGAYLIQGGTLRNCLIVNNSASGATARAGGVLVNWEGSVQSCTIASNYAGNIVGGFYYYNSGGLIKTAHVDNCVIYTNVSSTPAANNWYAEGVATALYVSNSCTVPTISAYGGNNIANDPFFMSAPNGNYRLSPNSPCINAGFNQEWMAGASDLGGLSRIDFFSRQVDIGAYEYLPQGSLFTIR